MHHARACLIAAIALACALAGCAATGSFRPDYLSAARRPPSVHSDGRVLLVTSAADDAYVFTGHPTSFSGRATSLTLPLGVIARETAAAAFADTFGSGVDLSGGVKDPARYVVIVAPRVLDFSYSFNQLKHAGLAVTPTAVVSVEVRVLEPHGATRWQRNYSSGPVEGPAYVLAAAPGDEINRLAHQALYGLFARAADDVVHEVLSIPAPAAR
jgi:hypothetical protein